jgi:hypothetical protein
MKHLEACGHCPNETWYGTCVKYFDRSWVNRRGGCGMFPLRDLPEGIKKRVGQQKQKHYDRSYSSKNSGRMKYNRVEE